MKSNNQKTQDIINSGNAKTIANQFHSFDCNCSNNTIEGSTILELIANNSNDFTADIAKRGLQLVNKGFDLSLSAKQAWCLGYQVVNNIELYKIAMSDFIEMCNNLND